jgi:hypothetical protein
MSILLRPIVGAFLLIVPALALAQSAPSPAPAPATQPSTGPDAKTGDAAPADRRALSACRTDAATICKEAAKGGRIACLRQNASKLSPECTAALAELDAKAKAMREACAEEVKANCAVGAKGRAVVQCLRESRAKLSPACSAAFEARYAKQ